MNIHEFCVAECQQLGEIKCHWVPGKENPLDLFTKEHKDGGHFQSLHDLMIVPLEEVLNIPTAPTA